MSVHLVFVSMLRLLGFIFGVSYVMGTHSEITGTFNVYAILGKKYIPNNAV